MVRVQPLHYNRTVVSCESRRTDNVTGRATLAGTVGRNCVLELDFPVDRSGRIAEQHAAMYHHLRAISIPTGILKLTETSYVFENWYA